MVRSSASNQTIETNQDRSSKHTKTVHPFMSRIWNCWIGIRVVCVIDFKALHCIHANDTTPMKPKFARDIFRCFGHRIWNCARKRAIQRNSIATFSLRCSAYLMLCTHLSTQKPNSVGKIIVVLIDLLLRTKVKTEFSSTSLGSWVYFANLFMFKKDSPIICKQCYE